jgi:hypothetical protein
VNFVLNARKLLIYLYARIVIICYPAYVETFISCEIYGDLSIH